MASGVLLLVYALAVARVTRMVTDDALFDGPRNAALARLPDGSKLAYLITCRWCASVYVAAVAAPVAYWWGDRPWFLVPAIGLAFSHVTGQLGTWERD